MIHTNVDITEAIELVGALLDLAHQAEEDDCLLVITSIVRDNAYKIKKAIEDKAYC